jgi:hypothetical protein
MNNSSTIVADDNNIQTTDDIVLELMEKVEQLEKTTDIQSINKELENVNNNINSINEQIIELKDGKKEISVSTNDTQLETFIQEFDALKEKVSNVDYNETLVKQINDLNNKIEDINIKLAAPSPLEEVLNKEETLSPDDTIYNKEIIEPDTNDVPYDNLNAILEHLQVEIDSLESKIKEINNNDVDSKINDLKTNYYVLASAIKPINDNITTLSNRLSIVETNTSITSAIDSIKDDIVVINKKLDDFNKDIQNINAKEEQKVVVESIPVQPQPCEIKQTTTIEPTISKEKETDVTAQNDPITENKTEEETTVQDITHKIYDVKIVENILHESRTASCRSEKERLLNDWPKLEDKVGGLLMGTAKNLASGTLVANGNTHLLIVYEYAQICNQLMEPKRHKDALEILKVTFNRDYDFIALPDNTWKEKRLEYHKYPTLTPINNPQLKIVEAKADKALTEHQKIVKKFDDMFGVTDEEE